MVPLIRDWAVATSRELSDSFLSEVPNYPVFKKTTGCLSVQMGVHVKMNFQVEEMKE